MKSLAKNKCNMQTTIFFGNGINLLGKGDSWDNILMQLSEGNILPPIGSNTLKYEYIVLNKTFPIGCTIHIG